MAKFDQSSPDPLFLRQNRMPPFSLLCFARRGASINRHTYWPSKLNSQYWHDIFWIWPN